jgi:uracil-DNA glycosylase
MKVSENPGCEGCPMRTLFPDNRFVRPSMPLQARDTFRLVVLDAPEKDDATTGRPFSGGMGRWLYKMFGKAGINREGVAIATTICCHPPGGVFPTDKEAGRYIPRPKGREALHHCVRKHLLPLLRGRAWRRIDIIGEAALEVLTGKSGIYEWRGSSMEVDPDEVERRMTPFRQEEKKLSPF